MEPKMIHHQQKAILSIEKYLFFGFRLSPAALHPGDRLFVPLIY
jgi:hypothetical protein